MQIAESDGILSIITCSFLKPKIVQLLCKIVNEIHRFAVGKFGSFFLFLVPSKHNQRVLHNFLRSTDIYFGDFEIIKCAFLSFLPINLMFWLSLELPCACQF